jgi:hypothetical protein
MESASAEMTRVRGPATDTLTRPGDQTSSCDRSPPGLPRSLIQPPEAIVVASRRLREEEVRVRPAAAVGDPLDPGTLSATLYIYLSAGCLAPPSDASSVCH